MLASVSSSSSSLSGADLRGAENLTAEQFQTTEIWRDARLPASLQSLLTEQPRPPACPALFITSDKKVLC